MNAARKFYFTSGPIIGAALGFWLGTNNHGFFQANSNFRDFFFRKASTASQADANAILTLEPVLPPEKVGTKPTTTLTTPSPSQQSRVSQIMRFGYPGYETLRTFEDFVLSYDRRNRVANWVVEHLTPERMVYAPNVDRKKCDFIVDRSIHKFFQSTNEDYFKSGYDRGHMAAAANHRKSQSATSQTFLLSNMAPQVGPGFNRGKWNDLEQYIRRLARKNRNVYVCTGPLYLPSREMDGKLYVKYEVIGKNNVAVPTHFFKVVLIESEDGKFTLESFVMPNAPISDDAPLSSFFTPIESIERAAGFLIFDGLPKQQVIRLNGKST